jgi:hypothetical protein
LRIEEGKRKAFIELKKPGIPELRFVCQIFKPHKDELESPESNPDFILLDGTDIPVCAVSNGSRGPKVVATRPKVMAT